MKYYPFPEKRGWKLWLGAFLLIQLMLTRSGMSGTKLGFWPSQILMLSFIGLEGILFLAVNRRDLKSLVCDRRMIAVAVSALVVLLPMILKQDWRAMYGTLLLGLWFAIFLSYFTSVKEVAGCYVRILCVLAVYSLIATYLLRRLPDAGLLEIPQFRSVKKHMYYDFGFCYVSLKHVATRNFGIFREPGVHQFFLMLGLYLTNYWVEWKKERHMWIANAILAVTMLSTQATGGIIELGLFVVVVFFEKKMYRDKRLRMLAILAAVAACVVLAVSWVQKNAIYWFIYDTLLEKFVNRTDSVTERSDAIFYNIRLFLENPISGAYFEDVLHGVRNNTSSTLILLAACGGLMGLMHIIGWFALVWQRERALWANLALLMILFMSFNTQNLTWDLYFWMFPTMALVERGLPMLKKKV